MEEKTAVDEKMGTWAQAPNAENRYRMEDSYISRLYMLLLRRHSYDFADK